MEATKFSNRYTTRLLENGKSGLYFLLSMILIEAYMLLAAYLDIVRARAAFEAETVADIKTSLEGILNNANIDFTIALIAVLLTITSLVAALAFYVLKFQRKSVKAFLTIVFVSATVISILFSTTNLVYAFVAVIFLPPLLWHLMHTGEILSFFGNRLTVFVIRRLLALVPMILTISILTFVLLETFDIIPIILGRNPFGDAEQAKSLLIKLELVDSQGNMIPVGFRFIRWLDGFIHADLGDSFISLNPISDNIGFFLWETVKIQAISLFLAFVVSVVIGILAAYYQKSVVDGGVSAVALVGLSMPIFVTGILAILIFSGGGFGWFPGGKAHAEAHTFGPVCANTMFDCLQKPEDFFFQYSGTNGGDFTFWVTFFNLYIAYTSDSILHMVLPVLVLTFASMALFARLTRGEMLDVLLQDYIVAARANGLSEYAIIRKHALKNLMLPLITFLGLNIAFVLGGAPLTETVFSWPGLGIYFVRALTTFDIPAIQALTVIIALMVLIGNLVVDIIYTYIDPRITL